MTTSQKIDFLPTNKTKLLPWKLFQKITTVILTTAISISANTSLILAQQINPSISKSDDFPLTNLLALSKKNNKSSKPARKIRVVYSSTNSPDEITREFSKVARQKNILDAIAMSVEKEIRLPRPVSFVMKDCGDANAFYDKNSHSIYLCNELVTSVNKTFNKKGNLTKENAEERALLVIGTILFIFYHEVGHMLIGELNLPITGREEDVADQYSAHVFLDVLGENSKYAAFSQQLVMSAFVFFSLNSDDLKDNSTFVDEHSLNKQRAASLICMLSAKYPNIYAKAASNLGFNSRRLRMCREESKQISSSWNRLLAPYKK